MDPKRLEQLGMTVRDSDVGPEAELELQSQLANPLARTFIDKVVFAVVGERLVAIEPPEFIGLQPIHLGSVQKGAEVESQITDAFNENILQIQRRSKELQTLGIAPRLDPRSLTLTAELAAQGHAFLIQADRRGNFRLIRAQKGTEPITVSGEAQFELSEFRDQGALGGYLLALVGETAAAPAPLVPQVPAPLMLAQLLQAFGKGAVIPPTSAVELVVPVTVNGQQYRFAAARVAGDTFRGLLAGKAGKVWSDRFELTSFPGIATVIARALKVEVSEVKLGGEGG